MIQLIQAVIEDNFVPIQSWIDKKKQTIPQVLYSSVDLRQSSHKIASIDTNLFPAGFNNLCHDNHASLQQELHAYIQTNYTNAQSILLFCEDHTRNTYYLENIYQLKNILEGAGYKVTIATYFNDHPNICASNGYLNLDTAFGHALTIYCLDYIQRHGTIFSFDLCLLNNDLTEGKLLALQDLDIPMVPSLSFGWHARKKSEHILLLNKITESMVLDCGLDLDPWLLSTLVSPVLEIDINQSSHRQIAADAAANLLAKLAQKYKEHNISDTPYLVLKSDNGTYGMGVITVETPDDILNLNRKKRNKLSKGKASLPIEKLILQEGVPSVHSTNNMVSEEVLYQCNGATVGGFFRMHPTKSKKDILNATGMVFKSFCNDSHALCSSEITACGVAQDISKTSYVLAQLANLSAQHELAPC